MALSPDPPRSRSRAGAVVSDPNAPVDEAGTRTTPARRGRRPTWPSRSSLTPRAACSSGSAASGASTWPSACSPARRRAAGARDAGGAPRVPPGAALLRDRARGPARPARPDGDGRDDRGDEIDKTVRTPLAAAIAAVAGDLAAVTGPRIVIIVSDGQESCGGDPEAAVRSLVEQGFDVSVNVVGLDLDRRTRRRISKLAAIGNGAYYDAAMRPALRRRSRARSATHTSCSMPLAKRWRAARWTAARSSCRRGLIASRSRAPWRRSTP